MNKNYTGGPEPDSKATAEEKAGKNDHHQWRSKICDAAFDRAIKNSTFTNTAKIGSTTRGKSRI